jgi:SAM-dependent methyltransferase
MYEETLSERFADSPPGPVFEPERTADAPVPGRVQGPAENPRPAGADSFLDLLGEIERYAVTSDRRQAIAAYHAWISRNGSAPASLYAAWFNLGVELAATGDQTGAVNAYQTALALRPGFYAAAINLGTIMEAMGQPEAALTAWRQGLQQAEARTALLDYRGRLAEAWRIEQERIPAVLHIACGAPAQTTLPPAFLGWRTIRVDTDPDARPDFVGGLTDLHGIADGLADAVYSSQAIENLAPQAVPLALREIHRVLKPGGFVLISLPDLQEVARYVCEGRLEERLYMSPAGPVTPLDMLYGHRPSMARGNAFASPRTGFTSATFAAALTGAGFGAVIVQRDPAAFRLTAIGFRSLPDSKQMAEVQAQMLSSVLPAVLYTPPA